MDNLDVWRRQHLSRNDYIGSGGIQAMDSFDPSDEQPPTDIVETILGIGEGGHASILFDLITVPTEPFDGVRFRTETRPARMITGEFEAVEIEDEGQTLATFFKPDRDEIDRIGLGADTDVDDRYRTTLEIWVEKDYDDEAEERRWLDRPTARVGVTTSSEGHRRHAASGDPDPRFPMDQEVGQVLAVYPE